VPTITRPTHLRPLWLLADGIRELNKKLKKDAWSAQL
jgi:hypothetical protein